VIQAGETAPVRADIEALARINADAVLDALGLSRLQRGRPFLQRLIRRHTIPFARTLATYDCEVGRLGLVSGAAWLLERFIARLEVSGQEHIPVSGPVLVLANHPGLSDALALFASVRRDDLRVLAADRPFLRALPYTSQRLIYLAERPEQRMSALRGIATHLRRGGSLLTFPAGAIEPDPCLRPRAAIRLMGWSDRLAVLARLAYDVPVVPAVVRGVLSPAAQRHPLTRLRRRQCDRSWLGSVLQTIWRPYQQVTVRVAFGTPIVAAGLSSDSLITRILDAERSLIADASTNGHQAFAGDDVIGRTPAGAAPGRQVDGRYRRARHSQPGVCVAPPSALAFPLETSGSPEQLRQCAPTDTPAPVDHHRGTFQ
jgi:1-acyl-sn-glycerol-3-phosphate acyltransferase